MQFVSAKKTTSSFSLKTVWLLGIIIFLSLTIEPIRIPFGNSNSGHDSKIAAWATVHRLKSFYLSENVQISQKLEKSSEKFPSSYR